MRQPLPDGLPHWRSQFRVPLIPLMTLLWLICLSFTLFNSPSLGAEEETPKAIRRTSPETGAPLQDQKRVALIIGNADYKVGPLRNPARDAQDISGVLRTLGFTVQTKINVNQREMEEAVNRFIREIQNGDVALFYFSGMAFR
jgi:hypothetical protein